MASPGGSEDLTLKGPLQALLLAEPYHFDFFQAVRLLYRFREQEEHTNVGLQKPADNEIVHFGAVASLESPDSQLQEVDSRLEDRRHKQRYLPPLLRVNFMGAIGPMGVLPLYYTELVIERLREGDTALRDFLDIFHHRIISLFYRAWRKYRFQVAYEQREEDAFSQYLFSLIGLGTEGLLGRQRDAATGQQLVDDLSLLHYSGLLAQQPHSGVGLERILQDYFGIPVRVEQFIGAWYRLSPDAQCELDDTMFSSQRLGFGAVVGDEIWDPQARVRIVLGPLTLTQYLDFLPSGSAYRPLCAIARLYGGDEFDFEAQLILRRKEVPSIPLGEGSVAPQLGWLSWAKTNEMPADASQAILQLSR